MLGHCPKIGDDNKEIDTRGIQVALKKLRQWSREGRDEELDVEDFLVPVNPNSSNISLISEFVAFLDIL